MKASEVEPLSPSETEEGALITKDGFSLSIIMPVPVPLVEETCVPDEGLPNETTTVSAPSLAVSPVMATVNVWLAASAAKFSVVAVIAV